MPAAREQEHFVVHGLGSELNGPDVIVLQESEDAGRDSVRPRGKADALYPACGKEWLNRTEEPFLVLHGERGKTASVEGDLDRNFRRSGRKIG